MGRDRRDAELDEWLNHGDNLLTKLSERSNLYKEIKKQLVKLNNLNSDPVNNKIEMDTVLEKLNKTKIKFKAKDKIVKGEVVKEKIVNGEVVKYKGKTEWSLWIGRINQKKKDAERNNFYVSKSAFDRVMAFTKGSEYDDNATKSIEQLFITLESLGLRNISELYDLGEALKPYNDAVTTDWKDISLHDKEPNVTPSVLTVTKKIVEELKANKIHDYHSISSIRKKILAASKLEDQVQKPLADAQSKIEQLQSFIEEQRASIAEKEATIIEQAKALKAKPLKQAQVNPKRKSSQLKFTPIKPKVSNSKR